MKYLDHVISGEEVSTDPEKTAAVMEWPVPQSKKQVRSFLFCSYYRKYVRRFSLIAKSLYVLIENQSNFVWIEQCQRVFAKLEQALTSTPLFFSF